MSVRPTRAGRHRATVTRTRKRLVAAGIATLLTLSVAAALGASPAGATQAPGQDLGTWQPNWSWTYNTTFHYSDPGTADVSINESVTYTNAGPVVFHSQPAYQLNISGTITGGSGTAAVSGVGNANLSNFAGSVSGTEYVRRSDLALIQESQHQHLTGKASVSFLSDSIDATIDMTLDPSPSWKTLSFPLSNGDHWTEGTSIAYSGGFDYTASGAVGTSGSSPFDGSFGFNGQSSVSTATVAGHSAFEAAASDSSDGAVDNQWYAPDFHNLSQEHLVVPVNTDGATLTLDRTISGSSLPPASPTLSETVTPSLTCAGGTVTVSGQLSSGASGTPLTVTLDKSASASGGTETASTTTGTGGSYSVQLPVPGDSDGLAKAGARATWGVLVDGAGTSSVATVVVNNQDCTSLTYQGDTTGTVGTNATVKAKLLDLATGAGVGGRTVGFTLSDGSTVTAVTDASGVATATLPLNVPARAATVGLSFAGDSGHAASSGTGTVTIGLAATSVGVTASEPSITINDPVTFTATVASAVGTPTGTVQFTVDGATFGNPVALVGTQATSAPDPTLGLGNHTVVAIYSGDSAHATSTSSTLTVHVHNTLVPTTTSLAVSDASTVFGQSVDLTATVAPRSGGGDPTGSVTFTDGTTTLGTAQISNTGAGDQAVLTTSDLPVGGHTITATYSGDDNFDTSTSAPVAQSVAQAGTITSVTSDATGTPVSGQAVTYTATVSVAPPGAGTPDGTAQLKIDGANVGDPVTLSGGVAIFAPVTTLTAGTHNVVVTYSGTTNYAASAGSYAQDVTQAATTTVLNAQPDPSREDEDVTITATVTPTAPATGTPTGTVVFSDEDGELGVGTLAVTGGADVATFTISTLAPGDHTLTATYEGDADYAASDATPIGQTVIAASAVKATTTTLQSSLDPSTFGAPITFTATVATADPTSGDVPDGSVQFAVDGTPVGDPVDLDNGVAVSPTLASPDPGDHLVTAQYLPSAAYSGSGDSLTQTVNNASASLVLTSSDPSSAYGEGVHFHVAVTSDQLGTGVPTGVVQFSVDGTGFGPAVTLTDGQADSVTLAALPPGTHDISVRYGGSIDFLPETTDITQSVDTIPTTTVLTTSSTTVYGSPVTLTATTTPGSTALGGPSGTVTFRDGTTTLGTAPFAAAGTDGVATLTVTTLGAGTHSISASYSGDPTFGTSDSNVVTQTVTAAPTKLAADPAVLKLIPLGLPLGTLRATLTSPNGPLAGQTLTFKIGSLTAGTAVTDANGVATLNAQKYLLNLTLALGYKVSYAGDADNLASSASGSLLK